MASKEPVSVIHPTRAESPAATTTTCSVKPVGSANVGSSMYFHVSERATRADAAPPNPLAERVKELEGWLAEANSKTDVMNNASTNQKAKITAMEEETEELYHQIQWY